MVVTCSLASIPPPPAAAAALGAAGPKRASCPPVQPSTGSEPPAAARAAPLPGLGAPLSAAASQPAAHAPSVRALMQQHITELNTSVMQVRGARRCWRRMLPAAAHCDVRRQCTLDGLLVLDPQGGVLSHNGRLRWMFGIPASEVRHASARATPLPAA